MEDHPKPTTERLFTRNDWIGCLLIALLITASNAHNYPYGGPVAMLERFIGSLGAVALFWAVVRGIYRWITKKRPLA
jgi:hypothetical protein